MMHVNDKIRWRVWAQHPRLPFRFSRLSSSDGSSVSTQLLYLRDCIPPSTVFQLLIYIYYFFFVVIFEASRLLQWAVVAAVGQNGLNTRTVGLSSRGA